MRALLHLPRSAHPRPPTHADKHGRHRFVRDGEVPVTVVNPRHGHPDPDPGVVAGLERALAAERQGRIAAEKALEQAQEAVRQLRTRLAHAEMAKQEADALLAAPAAQPQPNNAQPLSHRPAPKSAGGDAVDEAVEWWKPGWKERFRARRQGRTEAA